MRQDIVDAAKKYLDVPFHHQGRSEYGLDCIGLVVKSLADCGIEVQDRQGYKRFDHSEDLRQALLEHSSSVLEEPELGCIVHYKWYARNPQVRGKVLTQHIAIYAGEGIIIHSDSSPNLNKVCLARLQFNREAEIAGFYRV